MVLGITDDDYAPALREHFITFGDTFDCVISPLSVNVGADLANKAANIGFRKDHYSIHVGEGRDNFGALFGRHLKRFRRVVAVIDALGLGAYAAFGTQLSLRTGPWNKGDDVNYAHAVPRRLPAEVLYDAIERATGSVSRLPGLPAGARAAQLLDSSQDE